LIEAVTGWPAAIGSTLGVIAIAADAPIRRAPISADI